VARNDAADAAKLRAELAAAVARADAAVDEKERAEELRMQVCIKIMWCIVASTR